MKSKIINFLMAVVDAYTAWCGACVPLQGVFRKIKMDMGDPKLLMATANTSSIESLNSFSGTSKPITLFYGVRYLDCQVVYNFVWVCRETC